MGKTLQKKKGFSLPHVYAVILILMLLVAIMTYVVPAGSYVRVDNAVDPDSFTYAEQTPVGFLGFFTAIHQGVVESSSIIGAVLLISGCIQIIQYTGAFSAGIQTLIRKANGKGLAMVILFFTLFTGLGVIGYLDALYPFYPIIISLFITLGYDKMVGTAIILLSTAVGFTCGMVNPYTTGVAQTLVGLPMYSGIGFRAVGLVIFYVIALFFLTRYCIKIKKDPKNSVMGENYLQEQTAPMEFEEGLQFTAGRIVIILTFLVTIVISVVGSLLWKWGLPEITAIYFPVTILAVIISRTNVSQACVEFGKGMAGVVAPTMVIGLSRAVSVILTEGNITDTIIHAMADVLDGKSPVITLLVVYVFVTAFNFFVGSGSGKAVVLMPILQPMGQVLGINQQVMVLAYQYGDGFTNTFWPTSALLALSLCDMDYGHWFKFAWKIYVCLIAAGFALVVVANQIGYGPF
ncbi:YfcC family protein [Pseudoflavonifractor phocaeensis]|uniref:YfcC family protein n=1 Tax=Pseudoflavonifractor phocaeensis TaxID=1870988 RepID=UPI0019560969|nr:AbgT family transporter [Pseudoflavonifractor phocaeensis]MBM6887687.1 YfcC family protein [Pseudoflavonifractor phocaeensis]